MKITFSNKGKIWIANLSEGTDISIAAQEHQQLNCFYAPPFSRSPVVYGDFIGDTAKGGLLNFFNLYLNPHGNGTHTESVQHLDHRAPSVNDILIKHHFYAYLITVKPDKKNNNIPCIQAKMLYGIPDEVEALIIRTLPNSEGKKVRNYSGTNPPYITKEAIEFILVKNIAHLIVDLPSLDPETDGGKLIAHKTFWNYPNQLDSHRTITELVFIPDELSDGHYLINLNPAPLINDASPTRPILYKLTEQ